MQLTYTDVCPFVAQLVAWFFWQRAEGTLNSEPEGEKGGWHPERVEDAITGTHGGRYNSDEASGLTPSSLAFWMNLGSARTMQSGSGLLVADELPRTLPRLPPLRTFCWSFKEQH